RVDLLIVDSEGMPLLLHNETEKGLHWIGFNLVGSRSNRDSIGAMVTIEGAGRKLTRRCGTDGSYLSASDPRVHFGLGTTKKAPLSVTVRWPSGTISKLRDIKPNQYLAIKEPIQT
ncbi:MAG: enediyne biosynthesis protein, partial [Abditibacteriota bacterium]|nr:enediyne biosynthesis protein [Abditibacteriota bacterium]